MWPPLFSSPPWGLQRVPLSVDLVLLHVYLLVQLQGILQAFCLVYQGIGR